MPSRLSDLVYVPFGQDEWDAKFRKKRLYPKLQGDKDRSLLGKGGFSTVFRMRCSDVLYAVKVMNLEDLQLDEQEISNLEKEAKLLQRLEHLHVIQYHSHFCEEVHFYMVLEYASGGCLADKISVKMSPEEQLRLTTELASGLHYIHAKRVIHRDLKSTNILLVGDELGLMRVKISDFGLSVHQTASAASKRTTKSGTPIYFSPERGREDPYDYAADMWATGCIFLEFLLNELLKEALWSESKKELLRKKLDAAIDRNPLLGMQASGLLQHDATKRFNAADLYLALKKVKEYSEYRYLC